MGKDNINATTNAGGDSNSELRIGRKERDVALSILAEAYADERIQNLEEYEERVETVLSATTQTQLDALTINLTLLPQPTGTTVDTKDVTENDATPPKKSFARFLTFKTVLVGFLVAMWWTVLTPPETRTATVTSTTPTSCTESICEYPMALTLNTNETINVVGTFPRTLKAGSSEYETAITIGEKAKFRYVDGEWKQRMNIPPNSFFISMTAIMTLLCVLFILGDYESYKKNQKKEGAKK